MRTGTFEGVAVGGDEAGSLLESAAEEQLVEQQSFKWQLFVGGKFCEFVFGGKKSEDFRIIVQCLLAVLKDVAEQVKLKRC